jgi:dipeptidyl aminopeptidase/acylaminoacyl peptidase
VLGCPGDGDAPPAPKFEQPLVPKDTESAQHRVRVDAENCGEILRRRKPVTGPRLLIGDRTTDLGGDLDVQLRRFAAVYIDTKHGASHSSFLVNVDVPRHGERVAPPRPYRPREWLTALIKEARQRARRRRLRLAAGALLAAIAAFGIASGGLVPNGGGGGAITPRHAPLSAQAVAESAPAANGPLTLLANHHAPYDEEQIAAVGAFGATGALFHCPRGCYELTGFAWAPNGRWLAVGADTVSIPSDYNGLHLYNLRTGRDIRLWTGHVMDLSWSRDGSKLAYLAGGTTAPGALYVRDLTAPQPAKLLKTGTEGRDAFPTWSPDGRRIAFATKKSDGDWSVSTIGIDGRHRHFLARGSSPAWSPDGRLIAYRGSCGRIRLMTPLGKRLLTAHAGRGRCAEIGVAGAPVWSPDGTQIAMATGSGTYVMDRAGGHLELATPEQGRGMWGSGLPAWRPIPKP